MEQSTPRIIALPSGLEILYTAKDHQGECVTCQQQILLRKKSLSEWSVIVLGTIINTFKGRVTPANIKVSLGAVAYANYTSLKYWGLIEQKTISNEIIWEITETGNEFYRGELLLPENLYVFNDVPRLIPQEMYGRWVSVNDLSPQGDITRQSVVDESLKLDSTGQEIINI